MPNRTEDLDYLRDMPMPFAVVKPVRGDGGRPADLEVVYANRAATELAGNPPGGIVGTSVFLACPTAARDLVDLFCRTARTGEPQYFTRRDAAGARYYSVRTYCPGEGLCACVLLDVTDRAELERRQGEERRLLEHRATRDALTGLYHVGQGRRLVKRELARPRWEGSRSALFMFDVDDFKKVNDVHGHHRGDAVLRGFARILERSFRRTDIVFRAGGDEFSAFVADVPCACVVERICGDVIAGVERLSATGVEVSVSIGAAVGGPGWTYEAYYRAADRALYRIKRTGKSAYAVETLDGGAAHLACAPAQGACDAGGPAASHALRGDGARPRPQPAA